MDAKDQITYVEAREDLSPTPEGQQKLVAERRIVLIPTPTADPNGMDELLSS
jgi:hypothetical protein